MDRYLIVILLCFDLLADEWLNFYKMSSLSQIWDCAVPENINTPPMEVFLFCTPPPPPQEIPV